jgi:hypothetical protein
MIKKIFANTILYFLLSANDSLAQQDQPGTVAGHKLTIDSLKQKIPDSATVFTLSGLNFNLYNSMPEKFGGIFSRSPYQMVQVKYPASLAKNSIVKGVEMLDAALRSTPGPKIVLAHSQGAQVCSRWMREHANDSTAPGADELVFILTGNPLRANAGYIIGRKEVGGSTGQPTPLETPWPIIDFARRYDGWADWVQDEQNKIAVRNAKIGKQTLHKKYQDIEFFDSSHTIWSKGNTIFILTREEKLPVLRGRSMPSGDVRKMREQIEAAYTNRPGHDKGIHHATGTD